MTITESVRHVFSNYAVFTGRASRSEFWWWFLVSSVISLVLLFISSLLIIVWALAVLVPSLAVGWRRLHDTNLAGPFYLLTYVGSLAIVVTPALGLVQIVGLVLCARRGTSGPNRFGPAPFTGATISDPGIPSTTCPTCGKMVLPGQPYCPTCGTELH